MNKSSLLILLFCISSTVSATAQNIRMNFSPEVNIPTGNASNISGIGFGAALGLDLKVSPAHVISVNTGYNHFIGKKYFGARTQEIGAIPLKLGLKYFSSPDFYVEGQFGAAFHQSGASKTSFIWSPGFGTYFNVGDNQQKLAFGLRYEAWTNTKYQSSSILKSTSFGFIGVKLGLQFGQ